MSEDEQDSVPDTFKSKQTLDFFTIKEREGGTSKQPVLEVYPDYRVMRSKDLMVRAKSFYALWDEEKGLWTTDEFDVQRLVDEALKNYQTTTTGLFVRTTRKFLGNFSSNSWLQFRNYVGHLTDNHHELDTNLTFLNTEVSKTDYISKRLPYDLAPGDISAWDEIVGTLYDAENRAKIEWAIGAIVTGDSKTIQKFLVFYGAQGTGKSTILNIIQWMFEGYWTAFVSRDLVSANNAFALEAFKTGPLLAIEHDGDLSKVQDNSKLNSLVAHEPMEINEKNKPKYMTRFLAMLLIGTNTPVKITDSKSGLIRRLIDIHPTGNLIPQRKYQSLMNQIHFELGAIAWHCKEVYLSMGKDYYSGYKPVEMMLQTDVFFNYIESHYDIFKSQNGVTLKQAFELWKVWIQEAEIEWKMPQYKFREELRNYFDTFEDRALVGEERVRSWYSGFKGDKFKTQTGKTESQHMYALVMDETESLLDKRYKSYPAQYSKDDGTPRKYWDNSARSGSDGKDFIPKANQIVDTKLKDLDTTKEHYVKVPEQEIVIDFDLKGPDGQKSAERNLEKASSWPSTYAEFSKSGEGIHLHYFYDGDVSELKREYDDGIEIKVYSGNSSLRRRLTRCNNVAVATLVPGQLPTKEHKTVITDKEIQDEKHLRNLINKALRKEVNVGTKSNIDFIHKTMEDAYRQGLSYDVTDMKPAIIAFAGTSTNQAITCFKIVKTMKFASEDVLDKIKSGEVPDTFRSQRSLNADKEVIFDVEVFPNLFVVCWKYQGAPEESVVGLINPTPQQIENLLPMKLVGFNNRKYDNHILYGALQGFTNMELYHLSKKIIENKPGATFGQAYNLSYTDIYDFSSKRQSLKLWQNELGIHHMELGFDWDKPVPEELWHKVEEYCKNDVNTTDTVRAHLEPDFKARQILSELSGLSMNATTQQHTAAIVFGNNKHPQDEFIYTDLSEEFPGYSYGYNPEKKQFESTYKGEITGEGGLVRAKPGMYENVAVLDIASMHPTTIEQLNMFGDYTQKFSEIKQARVAIKRKQFDVAKEMLGGKLARYLDDTSQAKALANALKLAINIVYGLTSASFDNSFRDPKNIDNIVAKRGALFMIELMLAVEHMGFEVIHIKTDSIKIPNATPEIIQFVKDFGVKYGYDFEHEETFSKFCLVNDAVYIAKIGWHATEPELVGTWEAKGAQFQHPYVYKYLFSREEITFDDMTEAKSVQVGAQYLDFTGLDDTPMAFMDNLNEDNMRFIGKHGRYVPMLPGTGGGFLLRITQEGKQFAVTGTKGFQWQEAEIVRSLSREQDIDTGYFENLVDKAIDNISQHGDFEWFVAA